MSGIGVIGLEMGKGLGLRISLGLGLRLGLGLGLQSGLIFMFISQTAHLMI